MAMFGIGNQSNLLFLEMVHQAVGIVIRRIMKTNDDQYLKEWKTKHYDIAMTTN